MNESASGRAEQSFSAGSCWFGLGTYLTGSSRDIFDRLSTTVEAAEGATALHVRRRDSAVDSERAWPGDHGRFQRPVSPSQWKVLLPVDGGGSVQSLCAGMRCF